MQFNQVVASSKIQGLGYNSQAPSSLVISSYSQPAGSKSSFTIDIPVPDKVSTSMSQTMVTGTNSSRINDVWFQLDGTFFYRFTAPGYDLSIATSRVGNVQRFLIAIYNPTGVASIIPTLTINVQSYFYSAPW